MEQWLTHFLDICHFGLSIHNSNPINTSIENLFKKEILISEFKRLEGQRVNYIVSAYMACAYHGLFRTSSYMEILLPEGVEVESDLQAKSTKEFGKYWSNSVLVQLEDVYIRLLSLEDLMELFKESNEPIKELDAAALAKMIRKS